MAFKFKTKKRPTAAQAFAGGFAQGVSSGIQQAAQLSLQDRLKKQEEFKDLKKRLPQLINLAGLEGKEYEAAQEAQFMIRRGDIKSRDNFVSFLDGKSPGLSNRLLGATEPRIIGSPSTGYVEVSRQGGKTKTTPIIDAVDKGGLTVGETRQIKVASDKKIDLGKRVEQLQDKRKNAEIGFGVFTEEDQENLNKATKLYMESIESLDTLRNTILNDTSSTELENDDFSQFLETK